MIVSSNNEEAFRTMIWSCSIDNCSLRKNRQSSATAMTANDTSPKSNITFDSPYQMLPESYRTIKRYQPKYAHNYPLSVGSTATIWRHSFRPGVVIKSPSEDTTWDTSLENKYSTEGRILEILNPHPRIVKCDLCLWTFLLPGLNTYIIHV